MPQEVRQCLHSCTYECILLHLSPTFMARPLICAEAIEPSPCTFIMRVMIGTGRKPSSAKKGEGGGGVSQPSE